MLSLDPFGKPAPDLPIGVPDFATAVRVREQFVGNSRQGRAPGVRSVEEELADRQGDRVMSSLAWSTPDELVDDHPAKSGVREICSVLSRKRNQVRFVNISVTND